MRGFRRIADDHTTIHFVANHGRQQGIAIMIRQHHCGTASNGCDERIGRAQLDTDGESMLVRCGGFAGFGDLQECHESMTVS